MSYKTAAATTHLSMDESELRNALAALHPASYSWAVVCCRRDRELAEEVLQSVYVSLLDGRSTFAEKSSFRTWLFGVIRNSARDHLRGRWWSRVIRLDLEGLVGVVDNTRDEFARDQAIAVRRAMQNLPRRQRELIHLVFYEDLTIADAAQVMNISRGTASRHYERAKAILKQKLNYLESHKPGTKSTKPDARLI